MRECDDAGRDGGEWVGAREWEGECGQVSMGR